ncbi:MAG: hypothetical protein ACRCU6_05495 [Fusobacteriaceae bacterium]
MLYIGVREFLDSFKEPFDENKKAKSIARSQGVKAESILKEWEELRLLGLEIDKKIQAIDLKTAKNPILSDINFDNSKGGLYESSELVTLLSNETTYLQKPLHSTKQGLVGIPDKLTVFNNTIDIIETKAFKELRMESESMIVKGRKKKPKFLPPLSHIDDCNGMYAILQSSLNMYLAWESNKNLKVGKCFIRHVVPTDTGRILEDILIEVPYLRDEVKMMLEFKKKNQTIG